MRRKNRVVGLRESRLADNRYSNNMSRFDRDISVVIESCWPGRVGQVALAGLFHSTAIGRRRFDDARHRSSAFTFSSPTPRRTR